MDKQHILNHYSRKDIQESLVRLAKKREVAVRYDSHFGSRPDVLQSTADVLECAKQGATSFHVSEERWKNPLHLSPEMTRKQQEDLRTGWDLIIDVDCPVWEYSKLIAHYVVQVLKEHGVKSISAKFSGNKGFHIGVPFEAFPSLTNGKETRLLFPDGIRIIAAYIVSQIDKNNRFSSEILMEGIESLSQKVGIPKEELYYVACTSCKEKQSKQQTKYQFVCECGHSLTTSEDVELMTCPKCKRIMQKHGASIKRCPKCKGTSFAETFDLERLLSIDAILISSRHLYRMTYSLHEKSGLMSIPINPNKILDFDKKLADPEQKNFSRFDFLTKQGEGHDGARLIDNAFEWHIKTVKERELYQETVEGNKPQPKNFEITEALPEDFFPPCIKLLQQGIRDGRKRGIFILINFLQSVGYEYDEIEKKLKEWNENNPEPIRDIYIRGQLNSHKAHQKKVLPPNCSNDMYMKGMGICKPDGFCSRIKNPAQYAKKRAWFAEQDNKKGKKKTAKKKSTQRVQKEEGT